MRILSPGLSPKMDHRPTRFFFFLPGFSVEERLGLLLGCAATMAALAGSLRRSSFKFEAGGSGHIVAIVLQRGQC